MVMCRVLQIPRVLSTYAGGAMELRLEGATVGEMLDGLREAYPQLHRAICDETGSIRQHLNVFHNSQLLNRGDAREVQLEATDVVAVFQAVSGG